jgi:hypothetical protein
LPQDGINPQLDGGKPQFFQPLRLGGDQRSRGYIGQSAAAPQREASRRSIFRTLSQTMAPPRPGYDAGWRVTET